MHSKFADFNCKVKISREFAPISPKGLKIAQIMPIGMEKKLINQRRLFTEKYPEKTHDIDGRKWGVIKAGISGPALLLIPGTLGRADIFWQQIEGLATRAQVLSVTYPATHDLAEWAEDIAHILDRESVERTTILGSSLGGYLAQYFAAKYPERIDGLIAANTLSSAEDLAQKPPYSSDIANVPIDQLRAGFLTGLKARAQPAPAYQSLTEMLIAEVEGLIPEDNLKARLMALKYAPAIPPVKIAREKIVVIESADDPLIIPVVQEGVRSFLSPSMIFRFKQGGHFPYVVRPNAYLSILEECLGLDITGDDWGRGEVREL